MKKTEGKRLQEMDSVFNITIPGMGETVSVIVNLEGQNNPKLKYLLAKRAEHYMASIGQDIYDSGHDEGFDKDIEQGKIDDILNLVSEEGWDLDKAIGFSKTPDDRSEYIRNEVLKRLA